MLYVVLRRKSSRPLIHMKRKKNIQFNREIHRSAESGPTIVKERRENTSNWFGSFIHHCFVWGFCNRTMTGKCEMQVFSLSPYFM